MPAKKDIIKELRKEITELNTKIQNQRCTLTRTERVNAGLRHTVFLLREEFAEDATSLKKIFQKELAWHALSPNPNTQLTILVNKVTAIRSEADRKNNYYMNKNKEMPNVAWYLRRKQNRLGVQND